MLSELSSSEALFNFCVTACRLLELSGDCELRQLIPGPPERLPHLWPADVVQDEDYESFLLGRRTQTASSPVMPIVSRDADPSCTCRSCRGRWSCLMGYTSSYPKFCGSTPSPIGIRFQTSGRQSRWAVGIDASHLALHMPDSSWHPRSSQSTA